MCVIIVKPADKEVSEETLKHCFEANKDGWGIAWGEDDKTKTRRSTQDFNKFLSIYNQVKARSLLIHFRKATHGKVSPHNCHPFRVSGRVVMAHNGTFPGLEDKDKPDKSDTCIFNERLLRPVLPYLEKDAVRYLLLHWLRENRVVLFDGKEFTIYNEKNGTWRDGVWFSNMRWKPVEVASVTPFRQTPHGYGGYSVGYQPTITGGAMQFLSGFFKFKELAEWYTGKKGEFIN